MIRLIAKQVACLPRKSLHCAMIWALAAVAGVSFTGTASRAEIKKAPFPVKSMRLIVPFSAGGPSDTIVRVIAQGLSETAKQQVVVDNRPGANAILGTEIGAQALPDGYTLVMFAFPHGVSPAMYPKLPYNTRRDFAPVTLASSSPMLLTAHPSVPISDVRQLLKLARAQPGELTYASSGTGSTAHLALALMTHMAGVQIRHIPYKGAGQAITDVVGGHVSLYFGGIVALLPHVKTGKLKALAVSTRQRSQAAPVIPTIAEAGLPGYEVSGWYGIVVPAKTPQQIIGALHSLITGVLRRPTVMNTLSASGAEVIASTPDAFGSYIESEIVRWRKVIQDAGIRAQ